MQQSLDLSQELPVFFNQWRAYSRFTPLEDKLPAFFDELREGNQSQGGQSQAADLIHSRSGCCSLNEAFIAFTST